MKIYWLCLSLIWIICAFGWVYKIGYKNGKSQYLFEHPNQSEVEKAYATTFDREKPWKQIFIHKDGKLIILIEREYAKIDVQINNGDYIWRLK